MTNFIKPRDTEGTIVIAEAIKTIADEERKNKIIADLLASLCDNDAKAEEAVICLRLAAFRLENTQEKIRKYGNNEELIKEAAYGKE